MSLNRFLSFENGPQTRYTGNHRFPRSAKRLAPALGQPTADHTFSKVVTFFKISVGSKKSSRRIHIKSLKSGIDLLVPNGFCVFRAQRTSFIFTVGNPTVCLWNGTALPDAQIVLIRAPPRIPNRVFVLNTVSPLTPVFSGT